MFSINDKVVLKSRYDHGANADSYGIKFRRDLIVAYGGICCTIKNIKEDMIISKIPDDGYTYTLDMGDFGIRVRSSMIVPYKKPQLDLKVGDSVTIKPDWGFGKRPDNYRNFFSDYMVSQYGGKSFVIEEIETGGSIVRGFFPDDGNNYILKDVFGTHGGHCVWSSSMFDLSGQPLIKHPNLF